MASTRRLQGAVFLTFAAGFTISEMSLSAELSCAPAGTPAHFEIESDPFFAEAERNWRHITAGRPVEGDHRTSCEPVQIVGYENYPTWRCKYSDKDEGVTSLAAEVIVLNPSAVELARWSVHACRVNAVANDQMKECLASLLKRINQSNGAQYPVIGSVVESRCNADRNRPHCDEVPPSNDRRAAINTWWRDGLNVTYATLAKYNTSLPNYEKILNLPSSDDDIIAVTGTTSRISSAQWDIWLRWRAHLQAPVLPDGFEGERLGANVKNRDWGAISRLIHKRACRGDSNELMDAVVFSTRQLKTASKIDLPSGK